jgi:hypothetical protein
LFLSRLLPFGDLRDVLKHGFMKKRGELDLAWNELEGNRRGGSGERRFATEKMFSRSVL